MLFRSLCGAASEGPPRIAEDRRGPPRIAEHRRAPPRTAEDCRGPASARCVGLPARARGQSRAQGDACRCQQAKPERERRRDAAGHGRSTWRLPAEMAKKRNGGRYSCSHIKSGKAKPHLGHSSAAHTTVRTQNLVTGQTASWGGQRSQGVLPRPAGVSRRNRLCRRGPRLGGADR